MKIYFLGIGGIGVSALARYYHLKGHQVSGEDLARSEITDGLIRDGIKVKINPAQRDYGLAQWDKFSAQGKSRSAGLWSRSAGQIFRPRQIPLSGTKYDLLVYSPAILKDNSTLVLALKEGVKCQSYPETLGELTKQYWTIAVCGTHGKSTTTSMIGLMLTKAGLDPTVIVGTKLKEFGDSNCRVGKSKYLVIEADEHMASFLNYWPKVIVLTRIEKDHLDYYKNLNNIKKAFAKFIGHLPSGGVLITNRDDENIQKLVNLKFEIFNLKLNKKYYSLKQKEAEILKQILKVPGEHNVSNALAAYQVGRLLKIPKEKCLKALSEYHGAWRRFEEHSLKINTEQGRSIKFQIISDYGHHPTEVEVTLKATREKYPKKEIWCVFQPHQYQRTYYLFNDFIRVLSKAPINRLILIDIYGVAGRENDEILKQVSSEVLVSRIRTAIKDNQYLNKDSVLYIKNIKNAEQYIRKNIRGGEVVVIMGAGDIYDLTRKIVV